MGEGVFVIVDLNFADCAETQIPELFIYGFAADK